MHTLKPELHEVSLQSAKTIIPAVLRLLAPVKRIYSAVSFNSLKNDWREIWMENAVDDYYNAAPEFYSADFNAPFSLNRRFDLACCENLAEHISQGMVKQFINILCAHSDIVLFSAQIPFQNENINTNGQFPSYWAQLFAQNGYVCCDYLRKKLWNIGEVDVYYRQNTVLFLKMNIASLIPDFNMSSAFSQIDIVHPEVYLNFGNRILDLQTQIKNLERERDYYCNKTLSVSEYPDALSKWYKKESGRDLNLQNPQTFNEKMQWLKLYDNSALRGKLADKYKVRQWVAEKIGEEYLVPLIGVWDNYSDIDFSALPNRFALKCNNGSGLNIVVSDKSKFNAEEKKAEVDYWMSINYALFQGFELQYNNIEPKIIIEEFMENADGDIPDYKIWCFGGKPEYIQYMAGRKTGVKNLFYDTNWNLMPFTHNYPLLEREKEKPDNLNELLKIAETLSRGFTFVRVDLYTLDGGAVKFGEMTFQPESGNCVWKPPETDLFMGQKVIL
ncbi:MAG: hypothetical protein LBS21_12830 [Clostridiales bacterium]|jgi:hypothetical protein|nr:hypothetical protein [Clostridiales bacterium]